MFFNDTARDTVPSGFEVFNPFMAALERSADGLVIVTES
jgi:hypothetical protein